MIQIGINENIFIESAVLDEKGNIAISFAEVGAVGKEKISYFDNIASDEVVETEFGMTIKLFPPLPPKEGNDRTEEKNVQMLTGDINKTKGILLHLLHGWMTTEELKGKMDPFAGLPIDQNNFDAQIQKKEILEGIHKNLGRAFTELIKPYLKDEANPFRLLLVRQSTDKHYATLRGKYIKENPFWEPMSVPKEASKLKFTAYEIANGLDNGNPVAKPATGTTGAPATAPLTAKNVFGG